MRDTRPDSLLMKYSPLYIHTYVYIYIYKYTYTYRIPNSLLDSIPVYARTCTRERGQARMRLPLDERQ